MNPGKYTHRITFVTKISNDDGMGGGEPVTSDIIKVWANVEPLDQNQNLQFSQVYNGQGYNIECRGLKNIKLSTKNGIIFNGKLLSLHSCDTITDSKKIKIIAFE